MRPCGIRRRLRAARSVAPGQAQHPTSRTDAFGMKCESCSREPVRRGLLARPSGLSLFIIIFIIPFPSPPIFSFAGLFSSPFSPSVFLCLFTSLLSSSSSFFLPVSMFYFSFLPIFPILVLLLSLFISTFRFLEVFLVRLIWLVPFIFRFSPKHGVQEALSAISESVHHHPCPERPMNTPEHRVFVSKARAPRPARCARHRHGPSAVPARATYGAGPQTGSLSGRLRSFPGHIRSTSSQT